MAKETLKISALTANVGNNLYIVEEEQMFPESVLPIKKVSMTKEVILKKEATDETMSDFTFNGKYSARRNQTKKAGLGDVIFDEDEAKEIALDSIKRNREKVEELVQELGMADGLLEKISTMLSGKSPLDFKEENGGKTGSISIEYTRDEN